MTSDQLDSVLDENRLPDGIVWPIPILLQAQEKAVAEISEGERIALTDSEGRIRAVMEVGELYTIDIDKVAQKCFGTASRQHPGGRHGVHGGHRSPRLGRPRPVTCREGRLCHFRSEPLRGT